MIQQYLQLKAEIPDAILFFRLGDFYEMFFEDALEMSKVLEIALTGREAGQKERIPMCGVPYHAAESYIAKLVAKGYKVAIGEQVEDPKSVKGLVRREIVRVLTPGTANLTSLLADKENNYLLALEARNDYFALAAIDVSTETFVCTNYEGLDAINQLKNEITRYRPKELILLPGQGEEELRELCSNYEIQCNFLKVEDLEDYNSEIQEAQIYQELPSGEKKAELIRVCWVLQEYVTKMTKLELFAKLRPKFYQLDWQMILDASTRRSLELTQTMRDNTSKGSLLWVMDKTKTAAGGRLLHRWLLQPLTDKAQIEHRLQGVSEFVENPALRQNLQEILNRCSDLERLYSKISFGSANARDLIALKRTLGSLPLIEELLQDAQSSLLQTQLSHLPDLQKLVDYIDLALVEDPPLSIREGQMIKTGFNEEVDRLKKASTEGKNWLLELEKEEKEKTGIRNLKIGYNRVFGYYLEVTNSQLSLVPDYYIRKQTLTGSERYFTPKLKELEETILGAENKLVELEYELFIELRDQVAEFKEEIYIAASAIALFDVLAGLAELAGLNRYCKPTISEGGSIRIKEGRHPVVERTLKDKPYIANDLLLDMTEQRVLILTGPNMAGKSTYLRMSALIVLMAQMGSYVPAASAEIGLVDRIFTRVGSGDDLAGGQSTFMVEMNELSQILAAASDRSLLILDEIGRGTSTFDGMSIARASLEYIQNPKVLGARTLFATHYHELTDLEDHLDGVKNYSVAVRGRGEDIIFLHRIVPGGVDKSYGIEVARLAGLPNNVIRRAKEVLKKLEAGEHKLGPSQAGLKEQAQNNEQLSFLLAEEHPILKDLRRVDTLSITPIEALNTLHELQKKLAEEG
ncbi:MAG: DNA mismatch repair protein MutS [Firmicutes bacterium]|nr:DNA mismatch repair protein MutS [Bacillota bacterium]